MHRQDGTTAVINDEILGLIQSVSPKSYVE